MAGEESNLRTRFDRLRGLNAAWGVLAPFDLSKDALHIVEAGRGVSQQLADLAGLTPDRRDENALPRIDKHIDAIEREMWAIAIQLPVAQLRALLPQRLPQDREAIVRLLELLLLTEDGDDEGLVRRLSTLDFLITLLCTGGPNGSGELADPVGLTPRLHALSERFASDDDPRLVAIAEEFRNFSGLSQDEARKEVQLREQRKRKRDLGLQFFSPAVLRAVIHYNASLSRQIASGVHDSRDWGSVAEEQATPEASGSAFETQVLVRLADAVGRRIQGGSPSLNAVDRVAWGVTIDSLDAVSRTHLQAPGVGTPEQIPGTAVLVGLLCRSADLLGSELQAVGISPQRLADEWIPECDAALRKLTNEMLAAGAEYDEVRALSDLRTQALYMPVSAVDAERREARIKAVRPPRAATPTQEMARPSKATPPREAAPAKPEKAATPARGPRTWSWSGALRAGALAMLAALVVSTIIDLVTDPELTRMGGNELASVSIFLESGHRNGDGQGTAFVGQIDEAWEALPSHDQWTAADAIVVALRAKGVRDVMVYDDDDRLRIQAIGGREPVLIGLSTVPASLAESD